MKISEKDMEQRELDESRPKYSKLVWGSREDGRGKIPKKNILDQGEE